MFKSIASIINKHTTGASFVVFAAAGFLVFSFFLILYVLKESGHIEVSLIHHIDFQKLWYVIIISAIWFIASDIAKKKKLFSQGVHFFLDGFFYLITFGLIIYFTEGLHAGFFPLFFLAAMAAAVFGTAAQVVVFLIFLSVETYVLYFLTQPLYDLYHIGLLALYVAFYFALATVIKYFYADIKKSEEGYKNLLDTVKKDEAEARAAQEKYRDLIENTPLCIKVFDKDRNLVFINKGGREEHFLVGKSDEEVRNWKWWETVKPAYQAEAMEKFKRAFEKGEEGRLEFEHTPEGSCHEWCSSLISPIKDKDGKVKSVLFLSSDISTLKRAEMKAKQNEQMFKTLIDETPLCIKWFDKDGKLISINKHGQEEHFLTGLGEEEIKKWDYMKCIDDKYKTTVKERMERALKGEISSFEVRHPAGTATGEWCASSLIPVKNAVGEVSFILFISRDITGERRMENERKEYTKKMEETKMALFNILEDAKESERKLAEESSRSEAIISSMGEGLLVVDSDGKIITINSTAGKFLEVSVADAVGREIKRVVSVLKGDKLLSDEERPIATVLRTGKPVAADVRDNFYIQTASGRKFPSAFIISPLERGGTRAAVAIFRDISEEKRLDEAKSGFISVASHQLRTPLTSMRWFSEMLMGGDAGAITDEQKHFVERIYEGTDRMINLVNLLLQLARVEAGRVKIAPMPLDLKAVTKEIINSLKAQLKEKTQNVEINSKPAKLPLISLDKDMIWQVVQNLIANASRYSPAGSGIFVSIEEKKDGFIEYAVRDNGIGIPQKQQTQIFKKFFRADNAFKVAPEGSGLGLSLVKSLVDSWGGKVWFSSESGEEGKGTTFYFTIPMEGMKAKEGEVGLAV
ncbi:PAS domain S-box protein [Candidatus Falkowbacteria bacterium]|nr:PAS domain S-box protein [Candidatus Falkowbacteria bacterium]